MAKIKRVAVVKRQERIIKGVNENIYVRAQDFNPVADLLDAIESKDYADDTAAAAAGVKVGDFYHTAGVVKIRIV